MTAEDMTRESLERAIRQTVHSLREMADEIERDAERNIRNAATRRHAWNTYGYVAAAAVKTLTWGVANSNIDHVVSQAAEADAARMDDNR